MGKQRKSSARTPFEAALQTGELTTIQQLLAAGHKPDAAAADKSAEACNKAFSLANQTEKPLFGRKATVKEKQKAAADAETFYQITDLLLKAGAPVPQELCPAARAGNMKLALLLISHGADVDYAPPMGTPLENAVEAGNLEIVRALIKAGADIHVQGIGGTLITRAVKAGNLDLLNELLAAGVDLNVKPKFGATALHVAVSERKTGFVRRLLGAGADVNCRASITCGDFGKPEITDEGSIRTLHMDNPPVAYDSTPLILAIRLGFRDVAEQLIQAGADLEAADREGFTALVYAQRANNQEMTELLKGAGAKAPKYAEGSAEAAFIAAAERGDCSRLQELLAEGVDPNLKRVLTEEMEEVTALRRAAEEGHVAAVHLLIKAGARPDETLRCGFESDRQTALMHAALKGQYEAGKALMETGASPVARDRGGRTVVHFAAEGGNANLVRLLAKAGAKVGLKDKGGSTPLMEAAGAGHVEAAKALLELGADPNLGSKDGITPLVSACMGGHTEVVRLLLKAGASPKPVTPIFSPLEMASTEGYKEIVDLLLQAGARKTSGKKAVPEPEDDSALINAALMGKTDIVRTLLENGADPKAVDEEHFTALMASVRSGNLGLVQLLLKAGAEVNAQNDSYETALDLAYDNIKAAKDQAKFLRRIGDDDMDEETRAVIKTIQKAGSGDGITAALERAGGKRAKDLKGRKVQRKPEPEPEPEENQEEVIEVGIPDFSKRAKAPEFQKAIEEITSLCGKKKPKPLTNEDGSPLTGCVSFELPGEEVDRILAEHHEPFLKRGCYLLRSDRGYTSGRDSLTLMPTSDRNEVLAAFQTNGANCEIYPRDVMTWLDQLAKEQPFLLTGAGFDWCEGRFTTPLADSKKLAKKMYDFCPDIVDQGCGDVARLARELKKAQKFFFWWD